MSEMSEIQEAFDAAMTEHDRVVDAIAAQWEAAQARWTIANAIYEARCAQGEVTESQQAAYDAACQENIETNNALHVAEDHCEALADEAERVYVAAKAQAEA